MIPLRQPKAQARDAGCGMQMCLAYASGWCRVSLASRVDICYGKRMIKKWFYAHGGQTHGPYVVEQMKELVKQGAIDPQDRVWAEGSDPTTGVAAAVALDFKSLGRGTKTAVHGVTQLAAPAPATTAPPAPTPTVPGGTGVEAVMPPPAPAAAPPAKRKTGRSHAGSKAGVPLQRKGSLSGSKAGQRLKKGSSAGSKAGTPLKKVAPSTPPPSVPVAQPVAPPPGQPALTLQERFRKAQFALEQWADEEDSVDLILAGDMSVIATDPAVQAIFKPFQAVGGNFVDLLWKHFEFVVNNRRKYYLALVQRNQG